MLNKTKLKKELISRGVDAENLPYAIQQFVDLNTAIKKKWQVWAECEKYPRGNLDSGRHWYQIYYLGLDVEGNPVKHMFWCVALMDKNRDRSMRGYGFSSGAIGMSRLIDATDHIFTILKNCDGEYKQL